MTMLTHIAVFLSREVMGVTAYQRWKGIQHIQSDTGFMSNGWLKLAVLMLLVGSAISLVVVNMLRKFSERKNAEREFADGVAKRKLTPAETDTLIEIAIKAGLKRTADIFVLSDAFESGLDILFKESFSDGNPTNKTVQLEKSLANLKVKMNFRKVAKGGGYYPGVSAENSDKPVPKNSEVIKTAFIAMFPFSRKMDLMNSGSSGAPERVDSPPDWREQLTEFIPATITGLVGRVLFIETALSANVGDRVLVAVGSFSTGEDSSTMELIEEIGTVDRSVYLPGALEASNVHRLGVNLAGLSESQAVQLAEVIKGVNHHEADEQNAGDSAEAKTANVSVPVDSEENAE
jgi:hypothetical protein